MHCAAPDSACVPMPEPTPSNPRSSIFAEPLPARLPQRLRRRLAAFGIVGALMVALPLVQVLRFQNAAESSLLAEQAALDPAARAVDVERGLVVHRDLASKVLRGQLAFEPERRQRQAEVDLRLTAMAGALAAGAWVRAIGESDALRQDWTALAREVQSRTIVAAESDHAHRLLLEQCLQVIDLVGGDASAESRRERDATEPALALAHALPRLASRFAAIAAAAADPGDHDAAAQRLEWLAAEAQLARSLGGLDRGARSTAAQRRLAQAGAATGATADRFFALLRAGPASADQASAAGQAALQAQFRLFGLAQDELRSAQDARLAGLRRQRLALLCALLVLGLAALFLAARLLRGLRTPGAAADVRADATAQRADGEVAGRLLQRLRAGDQQPQGAMRKSPQDEAQPTLPSSL